MRWYLQVNDGEGKALSTVGVPDSKDPPPHPNQFGPFDAEPVILGKRFNLETGQLEDKPKTEIQKFFEEYPPEKLFEALQDDAKHADLKAASLKAHQESVAIKEAEEAIKKG